MYRKKLIEVALPLEAINKASAKEKSIRHGHPSTLHLWWARRPLATCRAVLFASLVDDPSSHPEEFSTEIEQKKERDRLFSIIERLVIWENINSKAVLEEAKAEIMASTANNPPAIFDPFCGGGSIPLEAQRLGLEANASDLNPVAVLITKALIEIPPRFANQAPVNPESRKRGVKGSAYPGALGLAEDVRHYGEWMREKALEQIGTFYPLVKLVDGTQATAIAWIWTRTVQCPNPACQADMPLVRSFQLSSKENKETWIEPEIDHQSKTVSFLVKTGTGKVPQGTVNRKGARCLVCETSVKFEHIRKEAKARRMGAKLMAIVAQGHQGRVYTNPDEFHSRIALSAKPGWVPESSLPEKALSFRVQAYGMTEHKDLFTPRQLVVLSTLASLVTKARNLIVSDGANQDYADAVSTYLGLAVSRMANTHCSLAIWSQSRDQSVNVFSRQAVPMNWDFPEVNPFAGAAGDFGEIVSSMGKTIAALPANRPGYCRQLDAMAPATNSGVFSTDPPYYDNIGYADLSDFFYVWLRKSLFEVYPELFSTLLVPKVQELVATPYRFGGDKEKAQSFFESGFRKAMQNIRAGQNPEFPLTVFYAFKQSDSEEGDDDEDSPVVTSTGWETMLEGLLSAGFQITGTWPVRSERPTGVKTGTNALASSILLVCRPRPENATLTTRKDFLVSLKQELGPAIRTLQQGNVAPVDLQQAAIGPGMAIFSRFSRVIESNGTQMGVRAALGFINQALDEVLSEQESDYDAETRWALTWFEQNQFSDGLFGEANTLANAKALSVEGLQHAGLLVSRASKVRLLRRDELPKDWIPGEDKQLTVWKVTQHLIHRLATEGQASAQKIAVQVGGMAETARELAYRLYTLCERKGWAEEAGYYNALVIAWPAIRSQEFTLTGDK